MKRYLTVLLFVLPLFLVVVPAALVVYFSPHDGGEKKPLGQGESQGSQARQMTVKVYRTQKQVIESIPLEQYVEGVVAAEMPAEFELEALKAQALAARTYIIKRLRDGRFDDVPQGAQVLDTVKHQAYLDEQQRRERWGEDFDWKNSKIHQAVSATAGIVLTYQGEPIDATFFSTSNGFTENANEYWEKSIPYLRSVASPWDVESPRFEEQVSMPVEQLEQKLGVRLDAQAMSKGAWYQVLDKTTGNRIGRIRIGSKEFTGKEVRERLGLNSSAFTMRLSQHQVIITTFGYGHGVGMSQWGANGMAKSGKKAEQIVKYFYQGISLQNYGRIIHG
ncbi:stage II sporulation protein D [Brevibacillus sp. SYP-B805]|uniref:stage II sporulation protein D n=1 Tax=Brevibacillus sp. SYP-B805 TaxID=1578199 RepID=UPI0013EC8035|nr:stage II sporulation protein D [Brevibacillus sp. SYP-B805]NGQ95579.1 stage II sporulation protein D [Brevibacillus sp. SYP-B805]